MRFERPWTTALVVGVISLTSGGWLLNQGTGVGVVESERLLQEVHRLISDRFVDEIAPSDLYQMAIDGMLREIGDPHIVDVRESSEFNGPFGHLEDAAGRIQTRRKPFGGSLPVGQQ